MSYYLKHFRGIDLDDYAIDRYPIRGKCDNSCYPNGYHRTGVIPLESILDGGLAGDSCQEFCIECGKGFKRRVFAVINQPNKLGVLHKQMRLK